MKRIWAHVFAVAGTTVIVGMVAPACAHNDESVFILQVMAPPIRATEAVVCLYLPDPAQPALFSGVLDVGVVDTYRPVLLVGNQLNARANAQQQRAESGRVTLSGGIVRVTDAVGNQLASFTSLGNGFAQPSTGVDPGYGLISIAAIDPPTAKKLRDQLPNRAASKEVVVYIRVFGQNLAGQSVETNELQFPVSVCNGCTVSFAAGSQDPAGPIPNCAAPLGPSSGILSFPCWPGQDQATPCQMCQGLPACDPKNP